MSRPHSSFRNLPIRGLFAVPALLAGVPVAALGAAVWTPSAVWGEERVPELSFINAVVATSRADIGSQVCPRHETLPDIREGDTVALQVRRQRGNWPEQSFRLDFEILSGSTADASDLGVRKTLKNALLRFPATPGAGVSITGCLHIDFKKDLKLEGKEILKLRLKPKAGAGYRVKSGADRQSLTILDDEKSKIRVKYENVGKLGGLPSQRRFNLQLEAGNVSKFQERGCMFTPDKAFSGTVKLSDWRVTGAANLSDFEALPSSVRFDKGVATIEVRAKMDGDTGEESFSIKPARARHGNGDWVGGLRGLVMMCEPTSANVPDGVVGPAGVIAPAAAAPSKPTGLGATASEDQVSLVWTANSDETITGWRYRLRSKGLSRWGSAVVVPSSGSATRRHGVSTSAYFHGVATEFQVQSYNAAGSSPWSDGATATVVNADNPILSISKEGVTVKEGERDTWTVKLNGALAGTVRLSEAERSTAGAIRLSPASLTFTEGTAQTPQTVTVTGVNAGTALFQGKRTGEVVVNHDFTLSGSSITTVASAGEVVVTVVEGGEAPGAPQRFEARPGNTQVRLEWAAPEDESITGYQVRQRVAGSSGGSWSGWRAISGSGALTTSHVVGKLTNGEKYLFQLRAVNGVGEGAASKRKGATPMGALTVAVGDGRMVEGDDGKKEMEFKVRLSGETVHDVKLQATAAAGSGSTATATGAGRDFVPLSQSVVFAAYGRQHGKREDVNDLEQTVRVQVVGDRLAEGDESFQLRLDNLESEDKRVALAGGGEKTSAVGVIVDDDAAPVLAALEDVTVTAGQAVNITAAATDADGDTVSYTWSRKATESTPALPQGTVLNQAKLAFTPTAAGVYTMTVTADDGYGNTASEEVTVTVGAPVIPAPAKPTGFQASGGNRQVTLTWDNPGNANITKYQVQQNSGAWVDISGSNAKTTSHTVTGLTNGTTYRFKIRAVAGAVEGAASDELSATPTVVVMAPRLTVTPQHGGDSCPLASLEWTVANTDSRALVENADSITGWAINYRFKLGGNWEQWLRLPQLAPPLGPSNAETRSRVVMACVGNGDQMQFRVRAVGQRQGKGKVSGPWSNVETATFTTDHTSVPDAPKPTGLKASAGNQQVTLSWSQPRYSIRSWQVQQKAGSNNYGDWVDISGSDAATTSHTVTGLTNGTLYTFRIRAVRGKSKSVTDKTIYRKQLSPSSDEVSATPGPATVSVPATLQVTEGTDSNAVVRVTASKAFGEAVTFNVSYGGTATADVDYDAVGTVTFNATDTSKDITIPLTDDNLDEDNETMTVSVTPAAALPGGFELGNATTTVTITDDDASPVLADMAAVSVAKFQTVDITAAATDADGDTLSYRWSRADATPGDSNYHCYLYVQDGEGWSTTELSGPRLRFTPATGGSCNMSVTAADGYGNTASKTVVITVSNQQVSRPNRPTGLVAQPADGEVTLSWDDPGDTSITGYQLRQKPEGGRWEAWTPIQGAGAETVSHTVTGLSNGTTYTYKIRAVNGVGHSEESKGVKATPEGVLRVTVTGDSGVTEGDEGQTEMVFTVQLSGTPSHEVRLQAQAGGVGANVGATSTGDERDVIPVTKAIVFPANARGDALRQEVRLIVLGDHRDERDEAVMLWLNNLQSEDKRVGIYAPRGRCGSYGYSLLRQIHL